MNALNLPGDTNVYWSEIRIKYVSNKPENDLPSSDMIAVASGFASYNVNASHPNR